MIRVPVKLPAMPVNVNGVPDVRLDLSYQEKGVNGAPDGAVQTVPNVTPNGTSSFDVTDGSNGEAWCNSFDQANNKTADSIHATWTNAADGTSSPAPDAPTLSAGDAAPTAAPQLGKMKKI
jgi:hypothetical protein